METKEAQPATQTFTDKHRKLGEQFIKYLGVALIGLGFDFGTMVLLHEAFNLHPVLAAAGGFIAGLIVNFALSIKYVFKNSKLSSRWVEFGLFGAVGLVGLLILSVMMWLLTDVLHVYYILAKIVATGVVYIWNFFGRKAMYRD